MNALLHFFDINETDVSVFRILTQMGSLPASSIALRLGVNRTTIFSSLKRLQEKELVHEIPKKGGSFFISLSEEQLQSLSLQKKKERDRQYEDFLQTIPLIYSDQAQGNHLPKVVFFEGEKGIITLFKRSLTISSVQHAFLTLERIPKSILNFLHNDFIIEKKEKGVFSKVLVPKCERSIKYQQLDTHANRVTKLVPEKTLFETEIIISGNTVSIIDFRNGGIGVFIESEYVANTMRSIFFLIWNSV